jgi:glutaredoxin 3
MPAKIEVYSKDYCPYCDKAKLLLTQLGAAFTEIDITHDAEGYAKIQARNPGARTVPQIFINNTPLGGCDALYALHEAGKLLPMLQEDAK